MKRHNESQFGKVVMGLGAIAAGLGLYFLYGSKEGPRRRKEIKGWMFKMRGEVLDELENLKDVTKDTYFKVVDDVKARYKNLHNVKEDELDEVANELKEGWDDVVADTEETIAEIKDEIKPRKKGKKSL